MTSTRRITWTDFGHCLRAIRTHQHLTQEKLGALLGFQRGHICRLEAGARYPSRSFLRLLAALPNVTIEERARILVFEEMRECHAEDGEA